MLQIQIQVLIDINHNKKNSECLPENANHQTQDTENSFKIRSNLIYVTWKFEHIILTSKSVKFYPYKIWFWKIIILS